MSCEIVKQKTCMYINVYIVTCVCFFVAFNVMGLETKAQSTDRNNIKSLDIHRLDYYNPGSSGDVNPEISNRGIILLKHFKPKDSWSAYEFNLSKYISIDTLDKLIEKVGTNKNDETVCVHRITRDTIYCHDYASVYPWLLERVDTNQYLNCITKTIGSGINKDVVVHIESISAKGHTSDNYGYLFTKNKIYDWDGNKPYDYLLIGSHDEVGEIKRFMITEPREGSKGIAKSMDDDNQIDFNRIVFKEISDRGYTNSIQRSGYMIVEDVSGTYWYIDDDFKFIVETSFSGMFSDKYQSLENVFVIKRKISEDDSTVTLFSEENPKGIKIDCSLKATFTNYQVSNIHGSWYVPILCKDGNKTILIDYKNSSTFDIPLEMKIVKEYGSFPDNSAMFSTNLKFDLKKREVQYKLEDKVIFMDKKKKLYVYESEKLIEINKKYIKDVMDEEF